MGYKKLQHSSFSLRQHYEKILYPYCVFRAVEVRTAAGGGGGGGDGDSVVHLSAMRKTKSTLEKGFASVFICTLYIIQVLFIEIATLLIYAGNLPSIFAKHLCQASLPSIFAKHVVFTIRMRLKVHCSHKAWFDPCRGISGACFQMSEIKEACPKQTKGFATSAMSTHSMASSQREMKKSLRSAEGASEHVRSICFCHLFCID